jgi:phage terminase large subunit GpA-like protein
LVRIQRFGSAGAASRPNGSRPEAATLVFTTDTAGLAYRAQSETTPWEKLRDRAAQSHYGRGTVPAGTLLMMLGIDCQGSHVEWQLVGFGMEFRRFVID